MVDMRRVMDELMESAFMNQEGLQQPLGMPMDVSETQDAYEINVSLPGVNPDDVEITLNNNTLTIRGEVRAEEEREDKTYHVRERRIGSFVRSIALPSSINADAIDAHYDNGVLRLRLPKVEEARPKRIQVQTGGTSKMIEGQSKKRG